MVPERVEVEPERVRRGRLGGFPPQLAHQREVEAGPDALHVGEDQGSDIQVRIEGWSVRIELAIATSELHGCACEGESERVVAFLGEQFLEETFKV
jgi:hypothetical protein